jgi:hypothetical protein
MKRAIDKLHVGAVAVVIGLTLLADLVRLEIKR